MTRALCGKVFRYDPSLGFGLLLAFFKESFGHSRHLEFWRPSQRGVEV